MHQGLGRAGSPSLTDKSGSRAEPSADSCLPGGKGGQSFGKCQAEGAQVASPGGQHFPHAVTFRCGTCATPGMGPLGAYGWCPQTSPQAPAPGALDPLPQQVLPWVGLQAHP